MIESSQKCSNCGELLSPDSQFCENCGHPVSEKETRNVKDIVKIKENANRYLVLIVAIIVVFLAGAILLPNVFSDPEKKANDLMVDCHKLKVDGKYFEAITCYDNALKIYPESDTAYLNKGICIGLIDDNERDEKAANCFERAYEFNSSNEEALFQAGMTKYFENLDCKGAIVYLSKIKSESYKCKVSNALYYCYNRTGDISKEKDALKMIQECQRSQNISLS
ncbi:MAG: zinc-ribbon domain-containing protein [Methanotrichaceae archaeon]|nr:zinc-ribbon domain-containing protein [Methanotrichaceae archaeon]